MFHLVAGAPSGGERHAEGGFGIAGDDVHDSAHRLRAVEGGHRSFDDLHAGDVVEVDAGEVHVAPRAFACQALPIDEEEHVAARHALEGERRQVGTVRHAELQARQHRFQQVLEVERVHPLNLFAGEDAREDGRLLQQTGGAGAGDDDLLQRQFRLLQAEAQGCAGGAVPYVFQGLVAREAHAEHLSFRLLQGEKELPAGIGADAEGAAFDPHGGARQGAAFAVGHHAAERHAPVPVRTGQKDGQKPQQQESDYALHAPPTLISILYNGIWHSTPCRHKYIRRIASSTPCPSPCGRGRCFCSTHI